MSWSAPNHAQVPWNSGMPMQDMNSGPYTPEQWALMQQQNWQQWSQWQQQYSQWQNQYGDKYAQQLQAVQSMGGIPPPPPTGAAPPPPPDKPPPPPPHENNQPLFNTNKSQPAHNPPQQRTNSNYNTNAGTGNMQWSTNTDKQQQQQQQPAANTEDLKKLVEEERLFDIQFQKWEEEIDKWRQENVNHPDKQAYKDYEAKFEACRKQLLERRQQMKAKRANLLNNSAGNTSIAPPPPPQGSNQNAYSQIQQPQSSQINSYERHSSQQPSSNRNNKNVEPQDRYESYNQNVSEKNTFSSHGNQVPQGKKSDNSSFLPSSSSSKGIPGLDLVPDSNAKTEVIDLSDDQPEGQNGKGPDYSTISMGINNILGDEKIMNILRGLKPPQDTGAGDSTPTSLNNESPQFPSNNQGNRNQNFNPSQNYGDRQNNMQNNRHGQFSQQNQETKLQFPPPNQGGNYNMNVMQQDQYSGYGGPGGPPPAPMRGGMQQGMRQSGPGMHQGSGIRQGGPGMHPGGPGMRHGGPGAQQSGHGMQQGGPGMRPNGPGMHQGGPRMQQAGNMQQGRPGMQHGGLNMQQAGPGMQQGGSNMQQGGPGMEQGGSKMQQGGPGVQQGGSNMQQGGPGMQQGGSNMQQGGPGMQQGGSNMQHEGPNLQQPPPRLNLQKAPPPLMANRIPMPMHINNAPGRPPLQEISSQQNDDYYGGTERPLPGPPPPKHKWVEEPLFNPSIVVEYEHKSLRLKARDFIEPVHTFDYNHISKDDEIKKKNFEHEADELFTRKPRRSERNYAEDRFRDHGNKDLYQRDYERRGARDECRDMPRDIREIRGEARDMRDMRDLRDMREQKDLPRDMRGEPRDMPRDIRGELRDMRGEPRDVRGESRDMRVESRDMRGESRDIREPRNDFRETDIRVRDDLHSRDRPRDDYERRIDDRYDERRRDDRDRYGNRRVVNNDQRDRDTQRDSNRDRRDGRRDDSRDNRRTDIRIRSTSRDKDSRKRALSRESEVSASSKKSKEAKELPKNKPLVMIDDLLEPPGRSMRPEKIVIILRGLPGSGKSYLAKLIRDREAENGGTARIMSIDDYFMQEGEIEEKDPITGKIVKKPSLKYEYDAALEETYINSLKRAFKRTLTDGYFSFLIYDSVNGTLQSYADIWNYARQNGFQVYICTMEQDVQSCFKRNIHNRTLDDIEVLAARFFATPAHHIQLDATTLLQNAAITDVQMEDVSDDVVMIEDDVQEAEVESVFTSKWEKMDDATKLARLDGTSKPLRPSQLSMEEYLQIEDWTPNVAKPGKKTVRWADIEESRKQEKMRAIGFVVGQTDWNRMTDPTKGSGALTQTKYIERNKRN